MYNKLGEKMISIICAATIWTNLTGFAWNQHDFKTFHNVQIRCSTDKRYKVDTPCVKTFTKSYEQGYRVICGRKTFNFEVPVLEV